MFPVYRFPNYCFGGIRAMQVISLAVFLSAVWAGAAGRATCHAPEAVAAYVRAHPAWRLLSTGDLVSDDQALWKRAHKHECPGVAAVVLDGSGRTSYALALVGGAAGKPLEQLVVLKNDPEGFREYILQPPRKGAGIVVWRAKRGTSSDMYTGRALYIAYDSIIWEKMESASQQFYFLHGKFHRLQASD